MYAFISILTGNWIRINEILVKRERNLNTASKILIILLHSKFWIIIAGNIILLEVFPILLLQILGREEKG